MKRGRGEVAVEDSFQENKRVHRKNAVVVSVLREDENVVHHCGKKWFSEESVKSRIVAMQHEHAKEIEEKERQHAKHVDEVWNSVRAQISDADRRVECKYGMSYVS